MEVENGKGKNQIIELYHANKLDPKILEIGRAFLDTINRNREIPLKACRMFVQQRDIDITFKISPVVYFSTVMNDLPTSYIEDQEIVILVYTGMEKLYRKDDEVLTELADLLSGKLINDLQPDLKSVDPNFSPSLFSYPTWECVLVGDSIVLSNTKAEPVWRVRQVIQTLPDSLK